MNKFFFPCIAIACLLFTACQQQQQAARASYNEGINIIPMPQSLEPQTGEFKLTAKTVFSAPTPEAQKVARFFAEKIKQATGFDLQVDDQTATSNAIMLLIETASDTNDEGYTLDVTPQGATIKARAAQGLFYGMQSLMQLFPAEIESRQTVTNVAWTAPCVVINDRPRFAYRGVMLDPCRHFMTVEEVKRQLDVFAAYKINRMHWHLTDDQGWRIEIKQYPKLTEIGAWRIEGEGTKYGGFYTQDQIKDIVQYAADRFITIVPEIELPGHEMAAIAAYPELSCRGEQATPRIIWGVEDVVLCAGKDSVFQFMENVFKEVIELFPSEYIHIGGDECPKSSWAKCPLCQQRIRQEGLAAKDGHTAEECLQSYFVQRIEKMLAGYGRKIIGWDEILEGGLAPTATVMSWRGEEGGIAAASMDHDVIMTPQNDGMYLDRYEGDRKIDPVTIGGKATIADVYAYDPVPDTLTAIGKGHFIKGVQCNTWSEYMYTNDLREEKIYPRMLAVAELAWTSPDKKDYNDFERRIPHACVRLDGFGVKYYIPQPEQPNGSCNFVAFTGDSTTLTFTTSRPIKVVYTLDGTEPTPESTEYTAPLAFTASGVLKIRSVLPHGKMSPVRTITVEKQTPVPAVEVAQRQPGLKMQVTDGMFLKVADIPADAQWRTSVIKELSSLTSVVKSSESMRGVQQYAAIAEGYVEILEDGVYYFSSDLEQVWIDGKLLIDNEGEVKRFSRADRSVALAKGLHPIKAVFLGHIIGGWPSNWGNGSISLRKENADKFEPLTADRLFQ